jgi:putative peptidoglycan lipid II flippase
MGVQIAGHAALVAALPPLVAWHGVRGASVAMLIGAAAQMLFAWGCLVADGMPALTSPWRQGTHLREFGRGWAPFLTYAGATQASGIVLRVSASTLGTGIYAVVSLALRLYRSLVTLILTPIHYVLLPAPSRSEAEDRRSVADSELVTTLRHVLVLIAPVVTALVVLRGATVSMLFERGDFGPADADRTAAVLGLLALAIVPTAACILLEQAAYARRRPGTVLRANLVAEAMQAALFVPMIALADERGVPLAMTAAILAEMALYLRLLRPRAPGASAGLVPFVFKVALACAALRGAILGVHDLVEAVASPAPGAEQAALVIPSVLAGTVAYVAALALLRVEEPRLLLQTAREVARAGR